MIGFCRGFAGAPRERIAIATFWTGVAAVPVGLAVVRHILTKSWGEFRIVLVASRSA